MNEQTDYEALVKELRTYGARGFMLADEHAKVPYGVFYRVASAIEALAADRDGWRDAAATYKASRDASDARAAADGATS